MKKSVANQVAAYLLEIEAIKLSVKGLFHGLQGGNHQFTAITDYHYPILKYVRI